MKSRLLLSVDQLPTISEMYEEKSQGGCLTPSYSSQSLDEYIMSICQLAQPTSSSGYPLCSNPFKMQSPPKTKTNSKPLTQHSSSATLPRSSTRGNNTLMPACLDDVTFTIGNHMECKSQVFLSTRDPLDWLFAQSQNN
ncbi:protein DEPP [Huso huso]|uniref:Protein DEPP n=1 Tax=Huso huso TaxID=61971 RepID=A0ABR0ZBD5_HUSHU